MIGLDSNVLIRLLVADDSAQHHQATSFLERVNSQHPAHVSQLTLMKTWWVLTRSYKIGSPIAVAAIRALVASDEVHVEDVASINKALDAAESGADFADALISAQHQKSGCTETVTFDEKAASSLGWRLL